MNMIHRWNRRLASATALRYTGSLLLGALIVGCAPKVSIAVQADVATESAPAESFGIWYVPGSLITVPRGIRDDYLSQIRNLENWPSVHANTAVFKQFIESLYDDKYSDAELKQLATFAREAGLKYEFEM